MNTCWICGRQYEDKDFDEWIAEGKDYCEDMGGFVCPECLKECIEDEENC